MTVGESDIFFLSVGKGAKEWEGVE